MLQINLIAPPPKDQERFNLAFQIHALVPFIATYSKLKCNYSSPGSHFKIKSAHQDIINFFCINCIQYHIRNFSSWCASTSCKHLARLVTSHKHLHRLQVKDGFDIITSASLPPRGKLQFCKRPLCGLASGADGRDRASNFSS